MKSIREMRTVEEVWETFERVIHPDAPEEQRREMKLAFFAGASAMLALVQNVDGMADEDAESFLEGLRDETVAFAAKYAVTAMVGGDDATG